MLVELTPVPKRTPLMLKRRVLLLAAVGLGAMHLQRTANAVDVPKVVLISPPSEDSVAAFYEGLRANGWRIGESLRVETKYLRGSPSQYPEIAAEVVRGKPAVIAAAGDFMLLALKRASGDIPIVMTAVGDPVGRGLIESLARPGANVTGVSNMAVGFPAKWLELLKETLPTARRYAALRNVANPTHETFFREAQSAATAMGLVLTSADYRAPEELDRAVEAAVQQSAAALLVFPDPVSLAERGRLSKLTLERKLGSVALFREFAESGALFSYGPDQASNFRRAADYVDKILRGAKPSDLPVEQPSRLHLVVNLKSAKALGIAIPESIRLRADRVIE